MATKRKRVRLIDHNSDISAENSVHSVLKSAYKFKTKLNDDLLKEICLLLEDGLPIATACEYLGISQSTHFRWLLQGKQYLIAIEEETGMARKEWLVYGIYLIEVKKAIAGYLKEKIENINGNFTPAWVRDITILERRDYTNWGRNVTVTEREDTRNPDESFL